MGKWKRMRAGFSVCMAMAVLAGSFSVRAATQDRMTVHEGELICGQEEHTHSNTCYDRASASDAKKDTSDTICGLEEHVHDADCYESGESVDESLTPTEGSAPDQTPGTEEEETISNGDGSSDTSSEGTVQEDTVTESPEIEGAELEKTDLEETGLKETDPEEGIALMSARLEREGDTFRVSDFAELKEAIAAIANEGSSSQEEDKGDYQIELEADIKDWNECVKIPSPSILLKLNGHSITISTRQAIYTYGGGVTIRGTGAETITVASSVKPSDTIGARDNYIIGGSGGLELDNVRITAESKEKKLPPLIHTGGDCVLNNVTVEDYPVRGSLIYLEPIYDSGAVLTIQGGMFSRIHSDGSGAVVDVTNWRDEDSRDFIYSAGRTVIHDAVFRNNTATKGAAVVVYSENGLEIKGCVFEGNQATGEGSYDGYGGAVYVSGFPAYADVDIEGCSFTDNVASGSGGAIYCDASDLSMVNSTFEGNKASDGGALFALDGHISKTTFKDNRAENNGGAVYANGTVRMEDTTLLINKATYRGGAVYMEENTSEDGTSRSELILTDAVIIGNRTSENGYAVDCTYSLQMEGGRSPAFFDNTPMVGCGIYLHPSAKACTVYGTILGEGSGDLIIFPGSDSPWKSLSKGERAPIDPAADGGDFLSFFLSDKDRKDILTLSPVVLMDGNDGGETGSAIYGTAITFITNEKEVPEGPEPEKPEPEKPEPEKPGPVEPTPGETLQPGSTPEGSVPEQTTVSTSTGGRRRKDRDRSVSGTGSTTAGSSSTPGMSITKPYHLQLAATGRELTDGKPGWRLKKPDGSYAASEWVLETDGSWYLYGEDGYTCNGWQKVNGEWYYFDETTQNMKTDWVTIDGKWYYLNTAQGSMETGWVMLDGKWYFLGTDGALVTNGYTPDGFYVNDKGEWVRR